METFTWTGILAGRVGVVRSYQPEHSVGGLKGITSMSTKGLYQEPKSSQAPMGRKICRYGGEGRLKVRGQQQHWTIRRAEEQAKRVCFSFSSFFF